MDKRMIISEINFFMYFSNMFLANFNFGIMNGAGRRSRNREGMVQSYLINDLLSVEYHRINYEPTQRELLPRVRGQREAQHRHGGDQQTRHYQVVKVVHGSPPDLDGEGDVKIRLRTTLINHFVSFCRNTWEMFIIIGFTQLTRDFEKV